jgi:hypothetical protein
VRNLDRWLCQHQERSASCTPAVWFQDRKIWRRSKELERSIFSSTFGNNLPDWVWKFPFFFSRRTSMTNANASNYINLHVQGIGYLGRVREVTVRKGPNFMSATINAMSGEKGVSNGIQYTPFDVKGTGKDVAELLKRFQADAADENKRVTVQFTISDPGIHTFTYQSGARQGQAGTVIKGRLLKIQRVWIKDLSKGGDEQSGNVCVYVDPTELAKADAKAANEQRTGTEG